MPERENEEPTFPVTCPNCRRSFKAGLTHIGKIIVCGACKTKMALPELELCDRCQNPCVRVNLFLFQELCPYCLYIMHEERASWARSRFAIAGGAIVAVSILGAILTAFQEHRSWPFLVTFLFNLMFGIPFLGLPMIFIFSVRDSLFGVDLPLKEGERKEAWRYNRDVERDRNQRIEEAMLFDRGLDDSEHGHHGVRGIVEALLVHTDRETARKTRKLLEGFEVARNIVFAGGLLSLYWLWLSA